MEHPIVEVLENEDFLTTQIITYIGNKRALLSFIGEAVDEVKDKLGKDKLDIIDLFSGSGIVSRYLKQHAATLISNDLEEYAYVLNKCYLANKSEIDMSVLLSWHKYITERASAGLRDGFITEMYAPRDTNNVQQGERCFYTNRNARYIDTVRQLINDVPADLQHYFIAPLLSEASIKNNTSGVFKGFYKNSKTGIGQFGGNEENALSRITKEIELPLPVFSNFECAVEVYQEDANELVTRLKPADLVYLDPPYNQHPYGSNYFMLNLINRYEPPNEVSRVSGIPGDWNRSKYNQARKAFDTFEKLCNDIKARFLLISFNSDGFIKKDEMVNMLSKIGEVTLFEKKYNTFRGSRNLKERDIHVKEFLYLVEVYD